MNMGSNADAVKDPRETYFHFITTRTKTTITHGSTSGAITKKIPKAVATPFPPRNLRKMGKR